jgi:hypothetical protein
MVAMGSLRACRESANQNMTAGSPRSEWVAAMWQLSLPGSLGWAMEPLQP